jgi:purine-binding chemotaxis protein CheW
VGKRTCIVIVEITSGDEPQVIGVIVDAVQAVVEIAAADTLPAPSFGTRIDADFIAGMGKIDERFIILLNVERVLSADDAGAIGAIGTLAAAGEAGATGSALVLAGPV